jgi:hypothetical protein
MIIPIIVPNGEMGSTLPKNLNILKYIVNMTTEMTKMMSLFDKDFIIRTPFSLIVCILLHLLEIFQEVLRIAGRFWLTSRMACIIL